MQVPPDYHGPVSAVVNGKFVVCNVIAPAPANFSLALDCPDIDGHPTQLPDYDERFDVYYYPSDDGSVIYDGAHIIALGPVEPPRLPDEALLRKHLISAISPMIGNDNVHRSDVTWAMLFLRRAEYVYAEWTQTHDEVEAQKALVQRIFEPWLLS
jgi:hypothetical protein